MATTAIWAIKSNLSYVLDYTSNPEKTEVQNDNSYKFNGLSQVITYTTNDLKTEKQLYVTGINCSLATVKRDMLITKKQFKKEDSILAYHVYQSFSPGEVTAETAHQIGIELAEALWGERFEVLVSTHLDKSHYHNHFVINSISWKDGLRYYDNKSTYNVIRKTSDMLCRKYQLSIIENPKHNAVHYSSWKYEPTLRSYIKEDVDFAISHSMTMNQFVSLMERMGYKFKFNKHWAVLPPNGKRFIRLRSLSEDGSYTQDAIKDRILEISSVHFLTVQKPKKAKKLHFHGSLSKTKKITGLKALYLRYLYAMGIIPKNAPNKKRVHFLFREDLKYLDKITQEVTLLGKKNIKTLEDLENNLCMTLKKKDNLINQRRKVYNKIRRCKDEEKKELLKKDISSYSKEIKEISKEIILYENINKRSISIQKKFEDIRKKDIDKKTNIKVKEKVH